MRVIRNVVIDDLRFLDEKNVIYLRNSGEAVKTLKNIAVEGNLIANLWFDHDLGSVPAGLVHSEEVQSSFGVIEKETVDNVGENGLVLDTTIPVLNYLLDFARLNGFLYPVDKVIVHTSNNVGRDNIVRGLESAGYSYEVIDAQTRFLVDW